MVGGRRIGSPRGLAWLGQWSFVRLLVFTLVLVAAYIGLQMAGAVIVPKAPGLVHDGLRVACAVGLALGMFAVYALLVLGLEARAPTELGLKTAAPNLAAGVGIGAGLFVSVYVVLGLMGVVRIEGFAGQAGVWVALAGALAAAVGEELAIRGGLFRVVEDMAGTLVAVLVSAAIFGLLHAANPGANLVSSVSIALEAGVLLGLAYALTRSLWLPIGLHFGWNFTEGGVFGAAVSGGQSHGMIKAAVVGPDLLTGGAFGPEASVVAVVLSLLLSAAMAWLVVRRDQWKPLTFRLRLD